MSTTIASISKLSIMKWYLHHPCDRVYLDPDSGITETFGCIRPVVPIRHILRIPHTAHTSVILKCARELDSLILQHSSSRDNSNCLYMLPELIKLKITAVHCEHLSTHLVTADGREDALVRRTISDDLKSRSTRSLPSRARSTFMAEDRGNSYAHIVGGRPPDDQMMSSSRSSTD